MDRRHALVRALNDRVVREAVEKTLAMVCPALPSGRGGLLVQSIFARAAILTVLFLPRMLCPTHSPAMVCPTLPSGRGGFLVQSMVCLTLAHFSFALRNHSAPIFSLRLDGAFAFRLTSENGSTKALFNHFL